MIKVLHIITTLGPAGAETMLCRLAYVMDHTKFENEIVSLTTTMDLAKKMQGNGTPVRTLGMKKGWPNPLLVMRLAKWIRQSKADVIHSWMYHANLVGAFAARLARVPVVWGIHHNELDPRVDKRRTILVNQACATLSRKLPARIVFCSEASRQFHTKLGYTPEKLEVIPNGFDLDEVKPDPDARSSLRKELNIPADATIVGIAARFHPHKDHRTFIRAASQLHEKEPRVHFLMCGLDVTWQNKELTGWIEAAGLRSCCHLLGVRQDMPRLFAGMDIAASASLSEAFPVVVGEAMACGTPCVVTDVGDSAMMVDKTGVVVEPGNPEALAEGLKKLIEAGPETRRRLGMAARWRVQEHFALQKIVDRYQAVYQEVVAGIQH